MQTVETGRMILRPWTTDDIGDYVRIFTKPETMHFPLERGFTPDEAKHSLEGMIAKYATKGVGQWAAVTKAERRVIGWIGLSYITDFPELASFLQVGWRLDPDYWHQGLATEGGAAGLDYAFGHFDVREVLIACQVGNTASVNVAHRLGAQFREHATEVFNGVEYPHHIFEVAREVWTSR
jgi:RimJ/RimL family protein N-acetyltransferase